MRFNAASSSPSKRSTTTGVVFEERASPKPFAYSTRSPSIVITSRASGKRAVFFNFSMSA